MSDNTEVSDDDIAVSIPIPIDIVDPTDEDAVLKRTQDVRLRLVSKMLTDQQIHNDNKKLAQLEKFLAGADKQVMGSRRMKLMERDTAAAESVAATLDRYVEKEGARLTRHDGEEPQGDYRPVIPALPKFNMKVGELDPVGKTIDVEEIIHDSLEKLRPGTQDQD